jgi:hypothetical protein
MPRTLDDFRVLTAPARLRSAQSCECSPLCVAQGAQRIFLTP